MALEDAIQALKRPIALLERETQLQLQHESETHLRALYDERSSVINAYTGRVVSAKGEQSDCVGAAYESMLNEMTAAKSELVHLSQKMLLQLESTRDRTSAMSLGVGALEQHAIRQTLSIEQLEHQRQEEAALAASRCNQLEALVVEQRAECQSYAQDLQGLGAQLASVQAQHEHDIKKATSTSQQLNSERQQHTVTRNRLRELEIAAQKSQSEKTAEQHRMRKLEAAVERGRIAEAEAHHRIQKSETVAQKYRMETAEMRTENTALRAQQQAAVLELDEHRKQVANMERERAHLHEKQLDELAGVRKELAEQLSAHRDELASVRKEHAEQLSTQSTEVDRVQQEHSAQIQRYRDEIATMKAEHGEQLQRQKRSADDIEARVLLAQSALDQETERSIELKVQLARAEAARETAEAELKMQVARAVAARDTAKAEHDRSLELQRDIYSSSQEVQLLRTRVNDMQDWSSDLAAENELLRAQLMELQRQSQCQVRDSGKPSPRAIPASGTLAGSTGTHLQNYSQYSTVAAQPHAASAAGTDMGVGGRGADWLAESQGAIDRHRHARQQRLGESPAALSRAPQHHPDLNRLV